MTTNAQWLAAIQAMTVTGVTQRFTYPPASLNTADLPASWPQPFGVSRPQIVSSCNDLNKTRTCTYYIAIEPIPQSTQSANYEAVIAMVDNLETALNTLETAGTMEFINYEIRSIVVRVAETDYWALEAVLTGSNYPTGG